MNNQTVSSVGLTQIEHAEGINMTSSTGNIFRVTGHLCWEFTGPRWIPRTKASDAEPQEHHIQVRNANCSIDLPDNSWRSTTLPAADSASSNQTFPFQNEHEWVLEKLR